MIIKSLSLKNFGCHKAAKFSPSEPGLIVSGPNGSGKTTVLNAWLWVMGGVGGNNADPILTGETDCCVSVVLDSGADRDLELTRTLTKKVNRKTGAVKFEYGYRVDQMKVKASEYSDTIATVGGDNFSVLTDALHFGQNLHWAERRKLLLQWAGVETADLADLTDRLKNVKKTAKEAGKEVDRLAGRIEEAKTGLEVPGETVDELKAELAGLEMLAAKIAPKETKIKEQQLKADLAGLEWNLDNQRSLPPFDESEWLDKIKSIEVNAERTGGMILKARDEYREVNARLFSGPESCSLCRQPLPENQKKLAEAEFNQSKSERLAEIKAEGVRLNGKLEAYKAEAAAAESELKQRKAEHKAKAARRKAVAEKEKKETMAKIAAIKTELAKLTRAVEPAYLADIEAKQEELRRKMALSQIATEKAARVEELLFDLKRAQKAESAYYSSENELTEKITAVVESAESQINEFLKPACLTVKLFEMTKTTGDVKECCQIQRNGLDYSQLSHGERVRAGLGLIKLIPGEKMPVFVDFAESISGGIGADYDRQVIELRVTEDKKLKEVAK